MGWGQGGAEAPEPPPPATGGSGGRARWGSGHYYKVPPAYIAVCLISSPFISGCGELFVYRVRSRGKRQPPPPLFALCAPHAPLSPALSPIRVSCVLLPVVMDESRAVELVVCPRPLLRYRHGKRQVSRRNSYSDRDMFEGGEDEEDVPMKASLTQPRSRGAAPRASKGMVPIPPPVVSGLHVLGSDRLFTFGVNVFPAPLPRPRLFSARRVRVKTLVSLVERMSISISMLCPGHEDASTDENSFH